MSLPSTHEYEFARSIAPVEVRIAWPGGRVNWSRCLGLENYGPARTETEAVDLADEKVLLLDERRKLSPGSCSSKRLKHCYDPQLMLCLPDLPRDNNNIKQNNSLTTTTTQKRVLWRNIQKFHSFFFQNVHVSMRTSLLRFLHSAQNMDYNKSRHSDSVEFPGNSFPAHSLQICCYTF